MTKVEASARITHVLRTLNIQGGTVTELEQFINSVLENYKSTIKTDKNEPQEKPNYCGGCCGKIIPKEHKFCSVACTKAWALD